MPSKQTGTRVLIEQVCTNKDTLILIFEELFGKEQATEMLASNKLGGKESLAQKIRTESGNTIYTAWQQKTFLHTLHGKDIYQG